MKTHRKFAIIGLSIVLMLLVLVAIPATPAKSAPVAQSNMIRNGDFEGGFYNWEGDGGRSVPNEWEAWWDSAKSAPRYNRTDAPTRIQSGVHAASYWDQFVDYDAGLRQIVPGVTAGTIYRLTAYGQSWSTTDTNNASSDTDVSMRIGIDPNGNTNPFDSAVVWSAGASPRDAYQLFSVEVTARAANWSFFLRGATLYPVNQTDIYWDNVSLVAIGQSQPPADQATATPKPSGSGSGSSGVPAGSIPKSTPAPDGSVVHVVRKGETLIGISETYKVSLEEIKKLNNLKGSTIYVGQKLVIKLPDTDVAPEEDDDEPAETEPPPEEDDTPAETDPPEDDTQSEPPPAEDTSGVGTICVMSYDDQNGNGSRDPQELNLAGLTFAVVDSQASTVGTYTTTGNEPYCFADLQPGVYSVTWTADGFSPTTSQVWTADINAGDTAQHEFGAQQSAAEAPGEDAAEDAGDEGGFPFWLVAAVGALGVVLLLSGIGAALYFFVLRPSAGID